MTTIRGQASPDQASGLLALPGEVRSNIFTFVLDELEVTIEPWRSECTRESISRFHATRRTVREGNIFLVSRLCHEEAMKIRPPQAITRFKLDGTTHLRLWWYSVGEVDVLRATSLSQVECSKIGLKLLCPQELPALRRVEFLAPELDSRDGIGPVRNERHLGTFTFADLTAIAYPEELRDIVSANQPDVRQHTAIEWESFAVRRNIRIAEGSRVPIVFDLLHKTVKFLPKV